MYITPAETHDTKIIYETYRKRYNLTITKPVEEALFRLVNGYVQYLQLALIILSEKREEKITSQEELFDLLVKDERITLQSEELYESITPDERDVMAKIQNGESITPDERKKANYLWDTGFIKSDGGEKLFSSIFTYYLQHKLEQGGGEAQSVHFSRKEHALYTLLETNKDAICERETIIEKVWPEYREFGVSDWAIDRLVARVRAKLKKQSNPYKIVTIRTRGYTLTST
jgi:hypothetical protein